MYLKIYIIWAWKINIIACTEIILPQMQNVSFLRSCVHKIEDLYLKPSKLTIFLNGRREFEDRELLLDAHIIQKDYNSKLKYFTLQKADSYLLIIPENLTVEVFKTLAKASHWNPRAKFIIIFEGNLAVLFKVLRKYYVFNVIAFVSQSQHNYEIFTYFPYDYSVPEDDRIKPTLLDICIEGELEYKVDLFPNKLPDNWSNTTVRLILLHYPPYVIIKNENRKRCHGMECSVLRLVQNKFGFKINYVNKTYKNWGVKMNDTYDGAYGDLQAMGADMAVGFFFANIEQVWDFDLLYPYMEDSTKWVVPAAKRERRWENILGIFSVKIWAMVFTLSILTTAILYWMAKNFSDTEKLQDPLNCFLICLQCLLGQCCQVFPRTSIIRLLFITWVNLGWFLSAIFQSNIILALTFDTYKRPISTVKELIDSKIEFGFHQAVTDMFVNPSSDIDKYILKNHIDCPLSDKCLNRTAFRGDFATARAFRLLQYMTSRYYLDPDGKPLLHVFETGVANTVISIALARGFPMFETLNKLVIALKSNGFIENVYRTSDVASKMAYYKKQRFHNSTDGLQLYELEDVFMLLALGWLIGFVIFLLECVWKKKKMC